MTAGDYREFDLLTGRNLAGCVVHLRLWDDSHDIRKSSADASQIQIINATTGACVVFLRAADTVGFLPVQIVLKSQWDVVDANGIQHAPAGKLVIDPPPPP